MNSMSNFNFWGRKILFILIDSIWFLLFLFKLLLKVGRISDLKKSKRSNPIYILGNGPSLNLELVMSLRNNVDICSVNFSVLSDAFFLMKPNYLVLADGEFFKLNDNRVVKVYSLLLECVNWPLTLIVPKGSTKWVKKQVKNNSLIEVIGYCGIKWTPTSNLYNRLKYFVYKNNCAHPQFQNVVIAAIYSAINLGYRSISLYGVEHSWLQNIVVNDDNEVCLIDKHFYNQYPALTPWRINANSSKTYKMHEILKMLSKTFYGYWDLRGYADYLGNVIIINKTKGSYIDAFDRG